MSVSATRLPAAERRKALIDTAIKIFAAGSYRGVTTAEIAKAAGVSEPILYRHFSSKRELYLAAIEQVWRELRTQWAEAIAAEPEPSLSFFALTASSSALLSKRTVLGSLWVQALAEASEDSELRKYLRSHLREVHAYVAAVMRSSQAAGGLVADRDADAEAWVFLAGSLLGTVGRRIGLLDEEDFIRIRAARGEWLSGSKPSV
jgi:AcrR family transcriptional regulator